MSFAAWFCWKQLGKRIIYILQFNVLNNAKTINSFVLFREFPSINYL